MCVCVFVCLCVTVSTVNGLVCAETKTENINFRSESK